MGLTLTSEQQRVLGVMIEKSLTHPGSYPLTLNAILLGCNQKSNREPLVEYSEGDVGRVLHELTTMHLVSLAPTGPGARSNRFQHRVEEQLRWGRQWQAVMAELLLRGPQTVGELRGRASRMVTLQSIELVSTILEELAAQEPAFVRAMPREPGRSAVRFMHLLYPDGQAPVPRAPLPASAGHTIGAPPLASSVAAPLDDELGQRVTALEEQVSDLRAELDELRNLLPRPA